MSPSLKKLPLNTQNVLIDNIFSNGIIIIICISLLGLVTNIYREPVIPYIPIVLLTILATLLAFHFILKKVRCSLFRHNTFIFMNIFGGFTLFSTIYSMHPLLTFTRSLQFIFVSNSLYIILYHIKDPKDLFIKTARLITLFSILATTYAIIIYYMGENKIVDGITVKSINFFGIDIAQRIYDRERASAFLGNPNPLGLWIMIGAFLCIFLLHETRKAYYSLFIAILIWGLILSGSRAPALGLAVGASYYISKAYIKEDHTFLAVKLIVLFLTLTLAVYGIEHQVLLTHLFKFLGRTNPTLSGREIAWAAFIDQVQQTPLFGIGYRISVEGILVENNISVSHSHNLYLSVLSEVGIVGFVFFILFIFTPLHYRKKDKVSIIKAEYIRNIISASILISIYTHQFFEDGFSPFSATFVFIIYMLYNISNISTESNRLYN